MQIFFQKNVLEVANNAHNKLFLFLLLYKYFLPNTIII
jgi:hypothetical protein